MVSLHNPSQASRAAATLHTDPQRALEHVQQIYREQIEHLRTNMQRFVSGETPAAPVHAYYPFVRMHTATVSRADTQLAYGFVEGRARTRPRSRGPTCSRATTPSSSAC